MCEFVILTHKSYDRHEHGWSNSRAPPQTPAAEEKLILSGNIKTWSKQIMKFNKNNPVVVRPHLVNLKYYIQNDVKKFSKARLEIFR